MNRIRKTTLSLLVIISLFLTMSGFTYDVSTQEDAVNYSVTGISINADRTSPTHVDIDAVGSLTSKADKITTTATLYEYKSGKLISAGQSVTVTKKNCTSYSFSTSFTLESSKTYKVKLAIREYRGSAVTSTTVTSAAF